MKEPKQKPTDKPVRTADKARLPRTAMRAVWLRTREGTLFLQLVLGFTDK